MSGTKIWGLAQVFNAVACICILGRDTGAFAAIVAFIGGIPVLIMFIVWLALMKQSQLSPTTKIVSTAFVMPVCTAMCSFPVAITFGGQQELYAIATMSVVSTFISMAFFKAQIVQHATKTNNNDTIA